MTGQRKSMFLLNLVSQFLVGVFFTSSSLLALSKVEPLGFIFAAVGSVAQWSVSIGILYAVFRFWGARSETLEWYYQNIPFGWNRGEQPVIADASNAAGTSVTTDSQATSSAINWEKIFSPDYFRYAGLLLVVTSIASFLFRINWELRAKILACLFGAIAMVVCAEYLRKAGKAVGAAVSFLVAFALAQFTATLSLRYFSLNEPASLLAGLPTWLAVKAGLLCLALTTYHRYPQKFLVPTLLILSFFAPLTISSATGTLPLVPVLLYLGALSAISLFACFTFKQPGLATISAIASNFYLLVFLWTSVFRNDQILTFAEYPILSNPSGAGAIEIFLASAAMALANLCAVCGLALRQLKEQASSILSLLVSSQVLGFFVLLTTQAHILDLAGFYGITLLVGALLLMSAFLFLRSKDVSGSVTEVLLNLSLIMSACGLFVETRGPWSAVVFLVFSCLAVYLSFVLGTLRTRVYAGFVLTASIFKLYLECSELFDSVPGTAVILVIGVAIMWLSTKLDALKKLRS